MNVMNYKQENAVTLVSFLSMLSVGTRVTIEIDHHAKILLGRIGAPMDVLRMCSKANEICSHHPRVYEVTVLDAYDGCRLRLRCI